jgi:hypothetical protein
MNNPLERRAPTYSAFSIGLALMLAVFIPDMPVWGAIALFAFGAALSLGSALYGWRQRKPLAEHSSSSPAPQRIGMDIEGGSTRLRHSTIKNQDIGVRSRNSKLDAKDLDVE